MRRLTPIILTFFLLTGCKTDFAAEIYASDIIAVTDGIEETIDLEATLTVETLAGGVCTKQAGEAKVLIKRFFGYAGKTRCLVNDFSASLVIPTRISLARASWDGSFSLSPGAIVGLGVGQLPSGPIAVLILSASNGFDKIQHGVRSTFFQEIQAKDIRVVLTLNNDTRKTVTFEVRAAFVNGEPAARALTFSLERRQSVEIILSDVNTLYLLNGGRFVLAEMQVN